MSKIILIITILFFNFHAIAQERIYKINQYHLSKLEIDSLEQSISNSSLVKKIIKNSFTYKDMILLYNPSNQIYLLKIVNSTEINNEDKRQLLINKIVYDWSRSLTDTTQKRYYNFCGIPRSRIDTVVINSKQEAINDYLNNHYTCPLNFSKALFVINGIPIISSYGDINTKTGIIDYLNLMQVYSITIINGSPAAALYGSRASNGAILIKGKEPKINLFFLKEKSLKKIK